MTKYNVYQNIGSVTVMSNVTTDRMKSQKCAQVILCKILFFQYRKTFPASVFIDK
jgi:hypothetical protein